MRAGYKVAAAGLVIVLGCSVAAFFPFGLSDSADTLNAGGQEAALGAGDADAGATRDARAASEQAEDEAAFESRKIVGSAEASEGDGTVRNGGDRVSASSGDTEHAYTDGVYRASSAGKVGEVPVTVTIEDGAIKDIRVGQNSEVAAMAEKAQRYVIPQILELQTTEGVDAASGATLTSDAIVDAVAQALERASAD